MRLLLYFRNCFIILLISVLIGVLMWFTFLAYDYYYDNRLYKIRVFYDIDYQFKDSPNDIFSDQLYDKRLTSSIPPQNNVSNGHLGKQIEYESRHILQRSLAIQETDELFWFHDYYI